MPDAREVAAFLRQCPRVGHHREGVHLEAVVVVKSEGLVPDDPSVQFEAARLQPLSRPRVAAVQHRHVVFPGHGVYRAEQAREVPLCVDVLLPVGREEDVLPFLQSQPPVDVRGLYLLQVVVQHLRHRGAGHVGPLLRQTALDEVSPRVLRVAQVHVGDDVHYPPVRLLRKALVLAPVARLHVEDRDVEPLRAYHAQAAVRIAEHQHSIGTGLNHQPVAAGDDVPDGAAEVVADGVHVHIGIFELQVLEEYPVEVVVVVLTRVGKQAVKVLPAPGYNGRQADNLGPRADDNQQLQPAVVLESYV